MLKIGLLVALLLLVTLKAFAQDEHKSIHQEQSEFYSKHPELIGKEEVKFFVPDPELQKPMALSKVVYGFHPYWISDATAQNYYFSLLTHFAYFSAEVDESVTATGGFTTTRSWATSQSVTYAMNAGKKVHLTITMFDNHDRVLANPAYRTNLVNNIISQLAVRSGDGVNIDFEGIAGAQAVNLRTFINELGTALKLINKELAICLPAVDWSNVFTSTFFSTNNSVVDYYFIMLYGYWWSGSSTAGPVAPLTSGTAIRHVTRSIDYYLSIGATPQRLVSGFPYYGYDWPVTSNTRMANATGSGSARTFAVIQPVIDTMNTSNKFFDSQYNVPWYRYQSSGNWRQTWYDDSLSLAKKYDSILVRNIAGTGIWALGYDVGYAKLWGALKNKFASAPNPLFVNLDDFENGVGRFNKSPTYSGSTSGISTASTSAQTKYHSNNGWASLEVILKDNTSSISAWQVRLLSGSGTPANNATLNSAGLIGLWMKTSTASPPSQIALALDDAAGGTELSPKLNVINDGNWNFYQWDFQSTGWTSFASGNGVVNGPTVTLDAIMLYAPNNSPDWTSYVDDVNYYQKPANPLVLTSTPKSLTRIDLNFTPNSNNYNVVIVWNNTGVFTNPFGNPPSVGSPLAGGTVLYNGVVSPIIHSGLTSNTPYYYKAFSYDGVAYSSGAITNTTTFTQFTLNLTALIEGFYNDAAQQMVSDSFQVVLRNSTPPYSIVEQRKIMLNSAGNGIYYFTFLIDNAPYYLTINHRNSIETWSSSPISFSNAQLTYNFTTDSAKAYGNNLIKKGNKWCIFSGDVNQDGIVDLTDVMMTDIDNMNFSSGYLITDLNGDSFTDISDLAICDNNKFKHIAVSHPSTKFKQIK